MTDSTIRRCSLRPLAASMRTDSGDDADRPEDDADPGDREEHRPRTPDRVQLADLAEPDCRQRDDRHVGRVADGPALDDEAEAPDDDHADDEREPDPDVAPRRQRPSRAVGGAARGAARHTWIVASRAGADRPPAYHRTDIPGPRRHVRAFASGEDPPMTTQQAAGASGAEVTRLRMVIGGQTVDAADGGTFEIVNPATGGVIATAPLGGPADVDRAVEAAQKAFEDPKGWSTWAASKRGRTLAKFAAVIKRPRRGAVLAGDAGTPASRSRRRAARPAGRAWSSTTTPGPRTRSSARRSRSRSRAWT